jgi:hypothetical protein
VELISSDYRAELAPPSFGGLSVRLAILLRRGVHAQSSSQALDVDVVQGPENRLLGLRDPKRLLPSAQPIDPAARPRAQGFKLAARVGREPKSASAASAAHGLREPGRAP